MIVNRLHNGALMSARHFRKHPWTPLKIPGFASPLLCIGLLLGLGACSSTDQLLKASGVRQRVYRQKTDLLLTELHYPITNNTNLDGLLRERILKKYQTFREQLDQNSIEYLNRGTAFTYKATFDVLRSPDLRIISFILYETWEIQSEGSQSQQSGQSASSGNISSNLASNLPIQQREAGQSSTTNAEVFMYSLRFDSVVDFLDVVEEPLLVFRGLAGSCLRQLNEYVGAGKFYSQGVKPDRQHLSMLSIGKSGIQVSFPPGQVMAQDQGVINILVPWAEAIPDNPWQFGIVRSFRPLAYKSRKKEAQAGSSADYLRAASTQQ